MPGFTYTGDAGRYYPALALTPVPGQVYDLAKDPGDGRWTAEPHAVPARTRAHKKEEASDAEA